MRKHPRILLAGGLLVALATGYLSGQQPEVKPVGKSGPEASRSAAAKAKSGDETSTETAADIAAIKKAGQSFIQAFKAGDGKAVASHWTLNGEYFADDGTTFRGRAAIEKAYLELFTKSKPPTKADIEVDSIRFPSKDTAIEEGHFKVARGSEATTSSKYTVLHVREGGKWLMAIVREWPSEGASIRDLEWLIGTWTAKRGESEITTTYSWWGDKTFIRVAVTIKQKDQTTEGFQMICKDAASGQIRSWIFDPDGSFGEATWTRDGRKWMLEAASVLADGTVVSATNILTPIDEKSFTFQSVHRTHGGEEVADIPPVRVTRVK